jgi:integrase
MSTTIKTQLSLLSKSQAVTKYLSLFYKDSKLTSTGREYLARLKKFEDFFSTKYDFTLDDLLINKVFRVDIYELLSDFVIYLNSTGSYTNTSIKQRVVTVRNLLEFYDIEISPRKFRYKVRLPQSEIDDKKPLTRELIIKILENCTNYRLKLFLLWLAATGMRAGETCAIRLSDIDFDNHIIRIKAKYTKTKRGRWIYMTSELRQYLLTYLEWKYRTREKRFTRDKETKHLSRLPRPLVYTPTRDDNDLIFGLEFGIGDTQNVRMLYCHLTRQFDQLLDRLGIKYETSDKKRREITLHSFRRYVKSVVADCSNSDYSEWVIGHKGSPYYKRSDKEKYEVFKKVEPYLTFLDQTGLEIKQKDTESRLEVMERENRELRDNMNKIMEMIQQNPKLAHVKPEVLTKKKIGKVN